MATFWRLASTRSFPLVATAAFLPFHPNLERSKCDAQPKPMHGDELPSPTTSANQSKDSSTTTFTEGMQKNAQGSFHGLFPMRQLFQPAKPYPLWKSNWDGNVPESSGNEEEDRRGMRLLRKQGVTRHIILVRHGQYDETHKEDQKRILTPLGREQAHLTGKRIAEMMEGAGERLSPCKIKALRVSALTRAVETADIIASYLPGVVVEEQDPMFNEGRPCHNIPGGPVTEKIIEITDVQHPRIEAAYRKVFFRAPAPVEITSEGEDHVEEKHEFEIIVCHANVIRYWMCRALQLPPEAWLRYCPFNCSLTYLTIRPTGTVSCRMLGDIGHLPYRASTFSGHHGFNW